jgi:hypothetical protein
MPIHQGVEPKWCLPYFKWGFSALSAPPENGGVPKANGPVPNHIQLSFFPIEYIFSFQNFGKNREIQS